MANVIPYVHFVNGRAAARFYEDVFGGEAQVQAGEDERVAHLELTSGGVHFMGREAPSTEAANSMVLNCDSEVELRSFYAKLADGGTEVFAPADSGWGAIIAHCVDRFGVTWLLNYDKPE